MKFLLFSLVQLGWLRLRALGCAADSTTRHAAFNAVVKFDAESVSHPEQDRTEFSVIRIHDPFASFDVAQVADPPCSRRWIYLVTDAIRAAKSLKAFYHLAGLSNAISLAQISTTEVYPS